MNGSQAWLEKDFYKILGVEETATEDQIRRAYRKLARVHHPDRNPGDTAAEERMKEIAEAYDVLSDPQKRGEYDQMRKLGASGFGGFGFGGGDGFNVRVEDLGDLGGIFSQMFGGGRRGGARVRRGEDLSAQAHLSFEEAMRGATVSVSVPHQVTCRTCGGSGAQPGTAIHTCGTCGGQGVVEENQGLFSIPRTCHKCGGTGRTIESPCRDCAGAGSVSTTEPVRVRIPAGVKDGARIRVRGRGDRGGDLYVVVQVAKHPQFERAGDDLRLRLPVTFTEAALGAEIRVPTLDGSVTLRVPPGTQNGRTLRVRGKGAPRSSGGYGDLLATVHVVVPSELSVAERELLEKFAAEHQSDPRAGLGA